MKHGTFTKLAKLVNVSPQTVHGLLNSANASPPLALLLGKATESDPWLWLKGGEPGERRAVLEAWETKQALSGALEASKRAVADELAKQEAIKAKMAKQEDEL